MRNSPFHDLTRPERSGGPLFDAAPQLRLVVLFALFLVPVGLIIARLYHVQGVIADRYISTWDRTEESLESIPARDGRILTADGQVLAYDQPRFDVALHYRWLEEPPNSDWLDTQARQLLKPAQRRDTELLQRARETVLQQRQKLHQDLAVAAGCSTNELQAACRRVQSRVERIYTIVEERQTERIAAAKTGPSAAPGASWSDRAWTAVTTALTTEPVRPRRDPLVIQEQLAAHIVLEDIPLSGVALIESTPARFPGVEVRRTSRRVYPAGRLASHIVGARTAITSDELAEQASASARTEEAFVAGDRIGRSGIERTHSDELRGHKGLRRIVRDRRGQVLRTEVVRTPVDGADVVLAFDSRLQGRAETLLDNVLNPPPKSPTEDDASAEQLDAPPPMTPPQGGCIVAIDIRSGRILAAAAAPRFDANLIVDHDPVAWNAAVADPRQPFFPRITQMTIPPGSVFKTMTAVAVIESGLIDPDATFHCQGYLDEPDRNRCLIYRHYGAGHGDVTLDDALCRSCNVYFFDAARKLGPQSIHDWAARFGLGRPTGVDIPGERAGKLPDPTASTGTWYPGTTLQFAIGQASLAVTPLQVAQMMAAVANDGFLVTPTFVRPSNGPADRSDSDIQLTAFSTPEPRSTRRAIPGLSPGTLARVRAGLRLVVEDDHGTGKRVRHSEVSIAGKTGTAETGGGKADHAWFAGYVPADEPRVAFVVVLEHGGSGGHVAGPIAHDFVQALLDFGVIRASGKKGTQINADFRD